MNEPDGSSRPEGPDFTAGIDVASLKDGGMVLGHVQGEGVLLARSGDEVFAVGPTCTHYGAPLIEGVVADGKILCPWHHACFELASGRACGGPALQPLPSFDVERRGDKLVVIGKKQRRAPTAAERAPVVRR